MMLPLKTYCNLRLFSLLLLGFSSGLPLALTSTTLQSWFTVSGISIATVGLLGLIGQPYIYKFLWAPLLDRYVIPSIGRRRGWMLITQVLLLMFISVMAFLQPQKAPITMGLLALLIAFFSASQDIAIDAYRTDILNPEERGLGVAVYVAGYRIAMLASGGLALIVADYWGWQITYLLMASLMLVGIVASWYSTEPSSYAQPPSCLTEAVIAPLKEFIRRDKAWILLLLILFYKLGDAFIISLINPFLLQGLHFTLAEVGTINKVLGLAAVLCGVFVGGTLLTRWKLFSALFTFAALQALANLLFIALAVVGKNYPITLCAVFLESFCSGLSTAALIAFLMSLCDHRYSATQYALFSALEASGRVFVGPLAGFIVAQTSWVNFFGWAFIAALPALLLLVKLRTHASLGTPKLLTA